MWTMKREAGYWWVKVVGCEPYLATQGEAAALGRLADAAGIPVIWEGE